MATRRILMIGLDGMEIGVLRRAFEAGRLPNLAAFCADRIGVAVDSEGEVLEGGVWPTFASGTGAGTHGHYWNMQWIAEEARFISGSDERFAYTPFWAAALEAGRRVIAFDIPYVSPVRRRGERHYSGWGLQDEMRTSVHPRSFEREVKRGHGRSYLEKDTLLIRTPSDRLKLARRMKAGTRQRARLVEDFVGRGDWELAMFVFGETHLAGHHLSLSMQLNGSVTNEQAMYSILEPLDEAWLRITAAAEGADMALFSIHGMRARVEYGPLVDEILRVLEGREPAPPPKDDFLRHARNLLPESLHEQLWLRLPERLRHARMDTAARSRLDLHGARVFRFDGDCAAHIRVNVRGRERYGTVDEDDVAEAIERLWREAQRYRTDDGIQLFNRMIVANQEWQGPRAHYLPDALLLGDPTVTEARRITRDDGLVLEDRVVKSRNGTHTGIGFCYYRAADGAVPGGQTIRNIDLAPSLLSRIGISPPDHLEGTNVFD